MQGETPTDYDSAVSICEDKGAHVYYSKTRPELNEFLALRPSRMEWFGKFLPFLTSHTYHSRNQTRITIFVKLDHK